MRRVWPRRAAFWVLALAVEVGLIWLLIDLSDVASNPALAPLAGLRPTILCLSLTGLNVVSYAVWWSRWNIVAHAQLAFSIVAYVIPIYVLHQLDTLPPVVLTHYIEMTVAGFFACLVGTLLGATLVRPGTVDRWRERAQFTTTAVMDRITHRTYMLALLSVLAVLAAFAVMGFAPALTADPLTAKFFRGAYAAAYAPVAPLYRFGTTAISLLLPLIAVFAWKRRTFGWWAVFAGSVLVMFLGLMRQPTASGLLLAIGVAFAVKRRHLPTYFALLIGVYFIGATLYPILGALGFGHFATDAPSGTSFWQQVAFGAPDIGDQVHFLRAWYDQPQYTHGLTFIGGLIPGNYPWNSSVWSLHIVNPAQNITTIDSGGLRLPAPIWGLVSFGWPGVWLVSFFSGVVTGYLARLARSVVPSGSTVVSTCWIVAYTAALAVFPVFFRLGYLSVLEVLIVAALLFWRTRHTRKRRSDTWSRMAEQHRARILTAVAARD